MAEDPADWAMSEDPAETEQHRYHIGEFAERVQLSHRTIRHYDGLGIVKPSGRTPGGFRVYTDRDVRRFLLIKPFKPLDIGLADAPPSSKRSTPPKTRTRPPTSCAQRRTPSAGSSSSSTTSATTSKQRSAWPKTPPTPSASRSAPLTPPSAVPPPTSPAHKRPAEQTRGRRDPGVVPPADRRVIDDAALPTCRSDESSKSARRPQAAPRSQPGLTALPTTPSLAARPGGIAARASTRII